MMPANRRKVLHGLTSLLFAPSLPARLLRASPAERDTAANRRNALLEVLGTMPPRPKAEMKILESVPVDGGQRLKVEYLAEEADMLFREPPDVVRAYLFVPGHRAGEKVPAVVAIHQDGPQSHLGKLETAGLAGDKNLHYGLELFRRGYVVLCPDRFGHAERRRGVATGSVNPERDDDLLNHRVGQLLLKGRTMMGKEAYDCMVAADVLAALPYVDADRLGALGHSAGGNALVYWLAVDSRVRAGVSSCGYFDMVRFFREDAPKRRMAGIALPGLVKAGGSAGYLAAIAPRSLLLTRGVWEWGREGTEATWSREHVRETEEMVRVARKKYSEDAAGGHLQTIYFEEDGGAHDFPPGVREKAYVWMDEQLRKASSSGRIRNDEPVGAGA